jgi:hypothetical protein
MNQPIRCEPLPFFKANGEAAAEARPCTEGLSGEGSDFSELLNFELDDGPPEIESPVESDEEGKNQETDETDALAAYGVAPVLIQLLPAELVARRSAETTDSPSPLQEPVIEPQRSETKAPELPGIESESPKGTNATLEGIKALTPQVVAEQKVPSVPLEKRLPQEQISGKAPEPAKKSSGMVAAQAPSMLMPSPSQDESVLPAEQKPGVEHFEAASFEPAIRIEPRQNSVPREKKEFSEVLPVEGERAPEPGFEAVSGEIELQPTRPIEPVTVVQEIRNQVELLKSSTVEKLDVVLRPDAQTELRVQVEKINGQVQVQVRCERGDFLALETHWGTIQNSLGAQGVRVEPLQQGSAAQFQQNGSPGSQNFSGHPHQREERPAVFFEQEFTNREATRTKASRGSAGRGWQSWA